jgi:MscS family membrane protein
MLPEQKTRIEMQIGVAYEADLERATTILHDILRDHDRILSAPTPEVNVASLGDNAVVLQILVWIDGPRGKRRVRDHVYRRALARFAGAGVEIPFPQRVVHLREAPASGDGHATGGTVSAEARRSHANEDAQS